MASQRLWSFIYIAGRIQTKALVSTNTKDTKNKRSSCVLCENHRDKRWGHAAMVGALIIFDRGDPCESGNFKFSTS